MARVRARVRVAAAGGFVYVKWVRASPATRAHTRIEALCGVLSSSDEKMLETAVTDEAAACVDDADSCMEAIGCVVGGAVHDLQRGFERSYGR